MMMKYKTLIVAVIILVAAGACTWHDIGSDSLPVNGPRLASVLNLKNLPPDIGWYMLSIGTGTKGYAGLGALGSIPDNGASNVWYSYDPNADSWSTVAALPAPYRDQNLCFKSGNKIYVGGGYNNWPTVVNNTTVYSVANYKSLLEYNPDTDQWAVKNDLPIDSADVGGAVFMSIGDDGYLLSKNLFWRYNSTSDTWESLPNLPFVFAWSYHGPERSQAWTSGPTGYISVQQTIWSYNTGTGSWTKLHADPGILFYIGNKGYYASQDSNDNDTYILENDLQTGTSSKRVNIPSMNIDPHQRYVSFAFVVGNKAYFAVEYRGIMQAFYEFIP
jgi:hypothetical protein